MPSIYGLDLVLLCRFQKPGSESSSKNDYVWFAPSPIRKKQFGKTHSRHRNVVDRFEDALIHQPNFRLLHQ